MTYFIASDIHGSAFYCEQMLEAYRREKADKLLLLGDILYHGPRNDLPEGYNPKTVIAMMNPLANDILCVRGNCDAEVDQMVLSFPITADYMVLPFETRSIFVTHGHIYHNDCLPSIKTGDFLLHGHTHVPACEEFATHIYINPGSVSIPKENSPHGYMIFDGKSFIWKTLDGMEYKRYMV